MLILLGVLAVLTAFIVGYVLGVGSGVKNALKSKVTTFDQTRDYLTPINTFIERELFNEIHRKTHDGKGESVNGGNAVIKLLTNSESFTALISHVVIFSVVNMSQNLKNSFYRIYNDDPKEQTINNYITQYCILRLRLLVIEALQVLNTNSEGGKREESANRFMMNIEVITQKLYGTIPESNNNNAK